MGDERVPLVEQLSDLADEIERHLGRLSEGLSKRFDEIVENMHRDAPRAPEEKKTPTPPSDETATEALRATQTHLAAMQDQNAKLLHTNATLLDERTRLYEKIADLEGRLVKAREVWQEMGLSLSDGPL